MVVKASVGESSNLRCVLGLRRKEIEERLRDVVEC